MKAKEIDHIECAIRHIETSLDVDPWARDVAIDAMKKQIPKTNADRIRAMSDEELARWFIELFDNSDANCSALPCNGYCSGVSCGSGIKKWLKQEVNQ